MTTRKEERWTVVCRDASSGRDEETIVVEV